MKIVFIGGRGIHILGGIENYMYNLTRELAKLGHECVVWCESDHDEEEELDGVRVIYHKGPRSNIICKPWCGLKATVRTLLDIKGVDVIHYNAWPPSIWNWIPRICGIPSLMEGHGIEWKSRKYGLGARKLVKFMEMVTAYINHHLIMCSEGQVKYFKEEYGKDSVCIPGAVNLPSDDAGVASDVLSRFGLEKNRYFLFVGRLVKDKNPDCLINAFCRAKNAGWKLVIAGANDAAPEYVSYLHDLGKASEDVVFTGAVYGEDKARLYRDAYCFCLPSTVEGLSLVMMEAASYRLPVIASDIEGNREFLHDDAIYVRPENEDDLVEALTYAVEHPEELEDLKNINYRKVIDSYTWDKVAVKYVGYLKTIVKK